MKAPTELRLQTLSLRLFVIVVAIRLCLDDIDRTAARGTPPSAAAQVWKRLPAHGPKTTILLDNEARKFRDEPRNGVVVPEFGPTEARRVCVCLASPPACGASTCLPPTTLPQAPRMLSFVLSC